MGSSWAGMTFRVIASWSEENWPLQRSPTFLAPGTGFVKMILPQTGVERDGLGIILIRNPQPGSLTGVVHGMVRAPMRI